ncbi:hypothetical protein B2J69_11670 [Pantoea latae]|uniref:Resolvase/invertase-type recombinase catalytic domain-containing protein n=1 Tax=Pantoea latae TaxID=1964541 RepID=A0A1V9DHR9_9GAMM|nr:hypothetical protein B2J69_11670 [Pantoea latae]
MPGSTSTVALAERRRILKRTSESRQKARLKGIRFGHRCTIDRSNVLTLHQQSHGAAAIPRQPDLACLTVRRNPGRSIMI